MRAVAQSVGGLLSILTASALYASCAPAPREAPETVPDEAAAAQPAAPPVAPNPYRNAYFGDLHVHTSWSLDAYTIGHPMLNDPAVAYRYGRGEAIRDAEGNVQGQLRVPLDFMAVTDHDNFLGEVQLCQVPGDPVYDSPICQDIRAGGRDIFFREYEITNSSRRDPELCGSAEPGAENKCDQRAEHQWDRVQEMADAFYEPGRFTTFSAFEFTGSDSVTGGWLHRNVLFSGEQEQIPAWGGSAVAMQHSPERLWEWLDQACVFPCDVLAIPHNTNYGGGVVLAPRNSDGTPFTQDILIKRIRTEPLIEIHQVKGNSECSPGLLTTDEDCAFEQSFEPCQAGQELTATDPRCAFASDYVRNALKSGLTVEAEYGINPFQYGIIGSTDDHKSESGSVDESTWPGDFFGEIGATLPAGSPLNNPGGLAGVWAEENTRAAIFAALRRRETFGTSGPRIRMRFFGGWTFPMELHFSSNVLRDGYEEGVPMGGVLSARPADAGAPKFVVHAYKDPTDAHLQKIQIIKGWEEGGETFERVYDVACSDGLTPYPETHRCLENGATVDLSNCNPNNDRGEVDLATTWVDPDFDPRQRAFYYVRVFQNPTCRWTTHRALATGVPPPDTVPKVIKERAWSSPIWYTPDGARRFDRAADAIRTSGWSQEYTRNFNRR